MFKKLKNHIQAKNYIWEFVVMTLIPIFITLFQTVIPDRIVSETLRWIITLVFAIIDCVLIIWLYGKNLRKREVLLAVKTKGTAYSNAYQLCERKRNEIAKRTYPKENGEAEEFHILKEQIPYNVHDYIAEICINFRDTIAQITSINQEYMSVTFIYHYDYKGATADDKAWRWVVGKESSTRTPLNQFVEREGSLYNYLINGKEGKINSIFSNDKKRLAYEGHYYMSARDDDHNKIGSVFAVKVPFGNNAENFVEGVLLVSSYGKQFVEKDSEYTENGLKNLIFEELYPYYQRLLETELGVLYLRHEKKTEKTDCEKFCDANHCCRKELLEKGGIC